MPATAAIATYGVYWGEDVLAPKPDGADPLWSPVAVSLTAGSEKYVQKNPAFNNPGRKGTRRAVLQVLASADATTDGTSIFVTVKSPDKFNIPTSGPEAGKDANLYLPKVTAWGATSSTAANTSKLLPAVVKVSNIDNDKQELTLEIELKVTPDAAYGIGIEIDFGYSASN